VRPDLWHDDADPGFELLHRKLLKAASRHGGAADFLIFVTATLAMGGASIPLQFLGFRSRSGKGWAR
jgi:hypothetical protein